MNYIDLFAGAGGLSEGFKRAGFIPLAHVEMDKAACYTLKTRISYYYLQETKQLDIYYQYLKGEINREDFYNEIPPKLLDSVINKSIGGKNNRLIFDVIDRLKGDIPVDIIIGGPPCQAYSTVGRGALKHKKIDPRKRLYLEYGKFLIKYNPKIFVFENVPGLKTSDGGLHFNRIKRYFRYLGYRIDVRSLNSWDFGVIQKRERLIIIGSKVSAELEIPQFEKISNTNTSELLFNDLPPLQAGMGGKWCRYYSESNSYLNEFNIRNGIDFTTLHIARPHNVQDLKIYAMAIDKLQDGKRLKNSDIPDEDRTQKNVVDFLDRFKVVDLIPHTMIAHIAKDGHHFIHPDINQLRSISVREAARIQSFPDNFYFEGESENKNRTAAFKQIGNAVPPIMAEKIAKQILDFFNGSNYR